jgi:hypothetical protein
MSTDPTEERWTMTAVRTQEARAEELAEKVAELRARETDLARAIAEGLADGQDVAGLQAERAEAVALRQDIETALPVLRERIEERRELAVRGEAERRGVAIARAHGSTRSSYDGDLSRIQAKAAELVEAVAKANARYADLQRLETEALFLLDRFEGLSEPAITRVHPPALQGRATESLRRVAGIVLPRPKNLPARLIRAPAREAALLRARIEGTPTADILEAAGDHAEDHGTRHRKAMEARRDAQDAARQAEMDRLDGWLRDQLTSGPVPAAAVKEAAQQEGIPVRGRGDGLSLREAAGRLGVVALVKRREGADRWWHIGRAPDGFELPRDPMRLVR